MRAWFAWFLGIALGAGPAAAIVQGQVDDFQDGTLQGWTGGSAPTNVANGGPDGAGDRYLEISSSNFHLGSSNSLQWAGDYLLAEVDQLVFHLNNLGPNPLALRVTLIASDGTAFTSTDEAPLEAGGGWLSVGFGLGESDLTRTAGSATLEDTLGGVTRVLLRHDPDPISPPGEANLVTGTLGIDNVTALPEPGGSLLLVAGLPLLAGLAWSRARRTGRPGGDGLGTPSAG